MSVPVVQGTTIVETQAPLGTYDGAAQIPYGVVQAVAPVPMQMQQPMATVPTQAASVAFSPYKLILNVDKKTEFEAARASVPPALQSRGVTAGDWADVTRELDLWMQKNFFYNCPALECYYWCVPGACVQTALCFCNPITCICCIMPMESAKGGTKAKCNSILNSKGVVMTIDDGFLGTSAVFSPSGG